MSSGMSSASRLDPEEPSQARQKGQPLGRGLDGSVLLAAPAAFVPAALALPQGSAHGGTGLGKAMYSWRGRLLCLARPCPRFLALCQSTRA